MRPFDEAALPVRVFLNGCSLVAERVNRSPGQIRGLAFLAGADCAAVGSACSSIGGSPRVDRACRLALWPMRRCAVPDRGRA